VAITRVCFVLLKHFVERHYNASLKYGRKILIDLISAVNKVCNKED